MRKHPGDNRVDTGRLHSKCVKNRGAGLSG
jgi:hypothetical protein